MSKKNLLNEATIRRFMKLANMEPLTSPFVDRLEEMHCPGGRDDDETMEEDKAYTAKKEEPGADLRKGAEKRGAEGTLAKTPGHGRVDYVKEDAHEEDELDATEDELGDEDHVADEEGAELDALEDEGADAPLDADVAARVEDALAGALEALAAELGDSLGVELDVETAPEEAELEVDVAAELEPTDGGEELDIAVDADEEPVMEEDLLESVEVVNDTDLINEVAKRVTARLVKAMAKK
jgi:hypothetical protein